MSKFLTFHKGDDVSKLEGVSVEVFPVKYVYGASKRDDYCADVSCCTWGYYHPATGKVEALSRQYALEHYGTVETRKRGSWGPHARHRSSYQTHYNKERFRRQPARPKLPVRFARPVEDLFFKDYGDANRVLVELRRTIKDYGSASVGTLLTLVGLPRNFTDERYGWTSLGVTGIRLLADSDYVIEFPDAKFLGGDDECQ